MYFGSLLYMYFLRFDSIKHQFLSVEESKNLLYEGMQFEGGYSLF